MFIMEIPPKEKNVITFGVLLNLVSASNADNEEVLWKFIQNFAPELQTGLNIPNIRNSE